jgi:hypothetical protein
MALSKKLQEVVERITRQREKLLDTVSGLSDAQVEYRPEPSAWSISDIVHHLALSDEATMKLTFRILKQSATLAPDPTPDDSVLNAMDDVYPRLTGKFTAPEFVTPHEHAPLAESLTRLNASRQKMVENLDQISAYDLTGIVYPHPSGIPLNAYQWFLLAGGHESRHTAQIKQLESDAGFPR